MQVTSSRWQAVLKSGTDSCPLSLSGGGSVESHSDHGSGCLVAYRDLTVVIFGGSRQKLKAGNRQPMCHGTHFYPLMSLFNDGKS